MPRRNSLPNRRVRRRGQVSYVSRAITPEEYNAAVARAPGACPLFAAGDLRSGRQVRAQDGGGRPRERGGRARAERVRAAAA
jgi:hypothetical protein